MERLDSIGDVLDARECVRDVVVNGQLAAEVFLHQAWDICARCKERIDRAFERLAISHMTSTQGLEMAVADPIHEMPVLLVLVTSILDI
jgi:hypothetical protein